MKRAWRLLLRNKQVNLINLIGLSIGLMAAFFLFYWSYTEWSFDRYHTDNNRIFRLTSITKENSKGDRVPLMLADRLEEINEIELVTKIRGITGILPTIRISDILLKEKNLAYIDTNWFNVFSYEFLEGEFKSFNVHPNSVILSKSKAIEYFGKSNEIIGNSLNIDGKLYVVRAVIEDRKANSSFHYEVFLPIAARHQDIFWKKKDYLANFAAYSTYIKTKPHIDVGRLNKLINLNAPQEWKLYSRTTLLPLSSIHFEQDLVWSDISIRGNKNLATSIAILAILVLIIVAINYINLATARTFAYLKTISIQKIIGASRKHIIKQLVSEALLMGLLTLSVSGILIFLLLPYYTQLFLNGVVLAFESSLIFLIIWTSLLLISCIYPIVLLSSFPPLSNLKFSQTISRKGEKLRKVLVSFQLITTIFLITCSTVIVYQMQYIANYYDTYNYQQLISVLLPLKGSDQANAQRKELIKTDLQNQLNIEQVSLGASIVNDYNPDPTFEWPGKVDSVNYQVNFIPADADFFSLHKIELKKGRWFDERLKTDEHNFILNETAVQQLGIPGPIIGKKIVHDQVEGTIVGIVKDFPFQSFHKKIEPLIVGNNLWFTNTVLIKTKPEKLTQGLQEIQNIIKVYFPNDAFEYRLIKEEVDMVYSSDKKVMTLAWTSTMLSILVCVLGLYGITLFSIEKRNKEISIRKVLGSSIIGIFRLLTKEYIKLVGVSLIISIPLTWISMNIWLANFAYKITISYWMFLLAGFTVLLITILTISFQTLKAATKNPVNSLRDE